MKEAIFVGNEITMEGVYISLPDEIKDSRDAISDAMYDVFSSSFCDREHRNFVHIMRMSNVLYDFIEHHTKAFCEKYKSQIVNISKKDLYKETKSLAKKYFLDSLNGYKQRVMSVEF